VTFREKALYHQIHPAKLATDIGATPISLYLFWQHSLIAALLVTFMPSIIASFIIIQTANLDRYKNSAFGRYLARYMTPATQALRFAGLIVMIVGAWYHVWWLIALGLVIVLLAWLRGVIVPSRA
jgi:hypothetical protein